MPESASQGRVGVSASEGGVCTGGYLLLGGWGVFAGEVCLLRGVSALGRGVSAPGECLLWGGVCSQGGCLLLGGVSAPGGVVSQYALRQTPPP